MVSSVTDGGRRLVVVIQLVRDGVRPVTAWDECEGGEEFPVEIRRNVTISVRFSEEEIAVLRARAEKAGLKVTAYIRAAAFQQAAPLGRAGLRKALDALSADVARAERLLGA